MKNLGVFMLFLFLSISQQLKGQNLNIAVTPGPTLSTVKVCKANPFTVTFTSGNWPSNPISLDIDMSVYDALTLVPITAPCTQGGTPNINYPASIQNISNTGMNNVSFNTVGSVLTLVFDMVNPASCSITFDLVLDCSIVPNDPNSNSIEHQFAFSPTNSGAFTINNVPAPFSEIRPVTFPFLEPQIPVYTFNAGYLDLVTMEFTFVNTGSADAEINFMFNNQDLINCDAVDAGSITTTYLINGTTMGSVTPGNWITTLVTVPAAQTLTIQQTFVVTGCLTGVDPCNNNSIEFQWRCHNQNLNYTCTECQEIYDVNYSLSYPNPYTQGIQIARILPANGIYGDFSCMNTFTDWEYTITNPTTNSQLFRTDYELEYTTMNGPAGLTLIDEDDIDVTWTGCPSCSLVVTSITPWNTTIDPDLDALCSSTIDDPVSAYNFSIYNMDPGAVVTITFKTFRCCEENNLLLNTAKTYNNWHLDVTPVNECNVIVPESAPGVFYGWNNWISNNIDGNVNMNLSFSPTVTDLSIVPGTPLGFPGASGDLTIITAGILNQVGNAVGQLLGSTPSAILKAVIHCDAGLRVETPATDVSFQSFDQTLTLPVLACEGTVSAPNCIEGDYTFYFDMTDPNAWAIVNNGRFNFTLTSCCLGEAVPEYSVTFSILFNDQTCTNFGTTTSTGPCSLEPVCTTNCCWLPLSSAGHQISVHCPGCLAPGIIIQSYELTRTTLGYPDVTNDGLADNTTVIDPSTYPQYELMDIHSSNYGDLIEDKMVSWFFDGDPGSNGYSYPVDMYPNAMLNYLQIDRIIPEMNTMDLQVESIELYIDIPAPNNSLCLDCDEYYDVGNMNWETIGKKCIPIGDVSNFMTEYPAEDRFFYTFSAAYLQSATHNCMAAPSFIEFMTGQNYRIKVNYRVCGNFSPGFYPFTDFRRTSDISNRMWLSGAEQAYNVWDVGILGNDGNYHGQMPNDLTIMGNWNYTNFDQDFANDFLFYCETFGGVHFFNAVSTETVPYLKDTLGCAKLVSYLTTTRVGNGGILMYPFEFKTTPTNISNAQFQVPPGWELWNATYSTKNHSGTSSFYSDYTTLSYPLSGTVNLPASITPFTDCITATNSIDLTIHKANDATTIQRHRFFLKPESCTPGAPYNLDYNDFITTNSVNTNVCAVPVPAAGCTSPLNYLGYTGFPNGYVTLNQASPNLTLSFTPPQATASSSTICWTFTISNPIVFGQTNTDAPYVYFNEPNLPFLNNWYVVINGGTPVYASNGILEIDDLLSLGETISGQLCATFTNCGISSAFPLEYGWNCGGFPDGTPGQLVCPPQVMNLEIIELVPDFVPTALTPGNINFTPCTSFSFGAQFNSLSGGAVYPSLVGLSGLSSELTVVQCELIYSCTTPGLPVMLSPIPSTYDFSWEITSADIDNAGMGSDGVAMECFILKITVIPSCNFDGILPSITVEGLTYCGDPVAAPVSMPYSMVPSGFDNCTPSCNTLNCESFSIDYIEKDSCEFSFNAIIPSGLPCSSASVVQWHFGDGGTASGENVTHQYLTNDTYIVCFDYICYDNEIPIDTCHVCDTIVVKCATDLFCLKIPKEYDADIGEGIMQTPDGGFVVASTLHEEGSGGDMDMYFFKYNGGMNLEYYNRIGDHDPYIYSEHGSSVLVRPDGYYVAGTIYKNSADEDVFVAKIGLDGALQYGFRYSSFGLRREGAHKIIDISSYMGEELLVVGYVEKDPGNLNVLALKLKASDLSIISQNSYYFPKENSQEIGYDVVKTGWHTMTDHYAIVGEQYTNENDKNVIAININTNLTLLSGFIYESTDRSDIGYGITAKDGDLYITGSSSYQSGNNHLLIMKLSGNNLSYQANEIFSQSSATIEEGRKIITDSDGNLVIVGTNDTPIPTSGPDALILKVKGDSKLDKIWCMSTNLQPFNERFHDVSLFGNDYYLATGSYLGAGYGDEDIFVAKIGKDGTSCCLTEYPIISKSTSFTAKEVRDSLPKLKEEVYGEFPEYRAEEYICTKEHRARSMHHGTVSESNDREKIMISPNPNSGSFTIKFQISNATPAKVKLYDISGRMIKAWEQIPDDHSQVYINASEISEGVYFIEVKNENNSWNSKVIINK